MSPCFIFQVFNPNYLQPAHINVGVFVHFTVDDPDLQTADGIWTMAGVQSHKNSLYVHAPNPWAAQKFTAVYHHEMKWLQITQ